MANPVRIVIEELKETLDKTTKGFLVDLTEELLNETPKDTYYASYNWIPYIGSPPSEPAGTKPPSGRRASDAEQRSAIASVLSANNVRSGGVVNNTDYIAILNEGSSTQAPAGFIQAAVERVRERYA